MKRWVLLLLLLTACGAGTATGPRPWPDGANARPELGQRAPNFKLVTTTGTPITLDQLRGKPVLVNFFATWCTTCREEMPLLERAGKAVQVVGVDLRDAGPAVATFGQHNGVSYPLLLDTDGAVNESYRVTNLPMTYLVDQDGIVRSVVLGAVKEAKLKELLALVGVSALP